MSLLKVTITEELTLNGVERVVTNEKTITNLTYLGYRTVAIPTTEVEVLKFGTAVGAGQYEDGDVLYLRMTNLGATEITLRILGNSEEYAVKIGAGESFILNNNLMDANATGSATLTLANIDVIKAIAATSASVIEYFIGTKS